MLGIFEPAYWAKARWDYMDAARACLEALTRQDGYWKYSRNDPRVKKALGAWVHRARNAHAFALGRKPVIPSFIHIDGGRVTQGALYTKPQY